MFDRMWALDLGYSGYAFTWNNKREGEENVQVRLDRATCNDAFSSLFPSTSIENILTKESNHMSLIIRLAKEGSINQRRNARQFRYEEMWGQHEGYDDIIFNAWERHAHAATSIGGTWECLKNITSHMQWWARTEFGSVQKEIRSLREKLGLAREKIISPGSSLEVRNIEARLHELYEREEIMQR